MTDQFHLCIHGHFYQPPREDPLTKLIPNEPGAEPFMNWNQRITADCYRPNADIGNFGRISFNLGPTLVDWMDEYTPDVLERIVQDDNLNFQKYGVGNALAQPYHHTIFPLATKHEKQIQVSWGIRSFEHTFKHKPEGMWLPETAVDYETLDCLAKNDIKFTILAPWQLEGIEGHPGGPFRVELPGGKSIIVFTYHQGLSTCISFDSCSTSNADNFAQQMLETGVNPDSLLLIASDGELYGHHQAYRDKFLEYLLNGASHSRGITVTYPSLWLKDHTVTSTARIKVNSSWSCHHGIERWGGECECTPGARWKKPLREALELLSRDIDRLFETNCLDQGLNPEIGLEDYIQVVLRQQEFKDWLAMRLDGIPAAETQDKLEKLFQAQMDRQRMFASCAWFFGDLGRIEPQNALRYAAHAAWLMYRATGVDLSPHIIPILNLANNTITGRTACEDYLIALKRIEEFYIS